MKKKLSVILVFVIIAACTKKAMPTIERRTEEPPAPVVEINFAAGEKLFTTRCARCHDLPKPSKYTNERWQPVLSSMIPRAGLSGVDAANVKAYIKANAATQ
jgi:cytochrome c2